MSPRFGLVLFVLPWFSACQSSGIRYHGVVASPLTDPSSIEVGSAGIAGPELGVITASCEAPTDRLEDGISYGDLACSEELLQSSMRETAAFVGGTHLVDTRCALEGRHVSCDSRVMRREGQARVRGASAKAPFDPFGVEVVWVARETVAVRFAPRPSANMVPRVPVSDDVVGEVSARCDVACDAARLRDAIALGARYAGAAHFGPPACSSDADVRGGAEELASRCSSWASTHRVDVVPKTE